MGGFPFGNAAYSEVGRHPLLWMPDWEVTEMRKLWMARAGLGQPPDSELRQRLATQLAVTSVLRSAVPSDAVEAVLEQVCRGLKWDLGVVWIEDAVSRELVCGGLWQPPAKPLAALAGDIPDLRSGPLADLAEAARDSRTATWLSRRAAAAEGVGSGVAVALVGGGRAIGVLELFGRHRDPDRKLGELLEGFGLQLGEAIARDEAVRWARSVEARRSALFDAAPDPVV